MSSVLVLTKARSGSKQYGVLLPKAITTVSAVSAVSVFCTITAPPRPTSAGQHREKDAERGAEGVVVTSVPSVDLTACRVLWFLGFRVLGVRLLGFLGLRVFRV
jgi:hypothetical protein